MYRFIFNRFDRIIYVSANQRTYWELRGLRPDKGVVIHNGVDTEHFKDTYSAEKKTALRDSLGFSSTDFVVGICAALRPEKKHEDLIDAISRLKAEGISAKCLIIGDGYRRAAIEDKVKRMRLDSDVVIVGFQTDVRPYIAICDCMTIVSHQVETFSNAALESMALGKPMVMSDIGGAAELVQDGVNGYLYLAGDVPALTAVLRKLANRQLCKEMGERARAMVIRDFDIGCMLDRYVRLFGG